MIKGLIMWNIKYIHTLFMTKIINNVEHHINPQAFRYKID